MSLSQSSILIKARPTSGKRYTKFQGNFHPKTIGFYKILCEKRGQLNMVQYGARLASFNVRRSEPELVRPSRPTPNELKLLSDVDNQYLLRCTLPIILFYSAMPDMKGKDPGKVIKNALADALVYYYPWAGRITDQLNEKLAVDCTADGVVFGEADADISLRELGEQPLAPPFPYLDKLLCINAMEVVGCPMFSIQVTRFSCGGFILALRFNHIMSDGAGLFQFLTAISELARGFSSPSVLPVWQRDLLNSSKLRQNTTPINARHALEPDDMVYNTFSFNASNIATLRARIAPHLRPCTAFELIAAALWHCRTIALGYESNEQVHLAFAIDARAKFSPSIPLGYYGNASTSATASSPAGKVSNDDTLSYALEQVKKARGTLTEEYTRSLIDPGILRSQHLPLEARTYVISDVSQLGLLNLDIGWGKPMYGGPANNSSMPHMLSFITSFRNEKGKELKLAPVYLPKDAMDRFIKTLHNLLKHQ